MSKNILEIEGVWSAQEIQELKNWISGHAGSNKLQESHDLAIEQSKEIQEIAYVEMERLKVPFTFTR